ncbi:MAG: hypothetical protein U0T83_03690 [Bacteriovoracaceae bacterium]
MDHRLGGRGGEISIDRPVSDDNDASMLDRLSTEELPMDESLANLQSLEMLKIT